MKLSRKSKYLAFISLLVLGIISTGVGAEKVLFPKPLKMELNVEEIVNMKVPLERDSKVYPNMSLKSENGTDIPASIRTLNLDLESEYIFTANNPVHFNAKAILREPEGVKEMFLILNNPDTEPPSKIHDWDKFIEYHKSLSGALQFQKKDFLTFELNESKLFQAELDLSVIIVIKKANGEIEILPLGDNKVIVHIRSPAEKLQIDTNRFTLSDLVVSNEALKQQNRSNEVVEGLTFVVLGFIFLEPAYRIYNSISSSDTRSK